MAFLWWRCRCTGVSKGKRHALLCALRDWTEGYWSTFHRKPLFSSARYQLKCIRNHYTVQRSLYLGKSLPRQQNVLVCLKQSIIAWSCYYFIVRLSYRLFLFYFVCVVLNCLSPNLPFYIICYLFIFINFHAVWCHPRHQYCSFPIPPALNLLIPFRFGTIYVLIKCLFQ